MVKRGDRFLQADNPGVGPSTTTSALTGSYETRVAAPTVSAGWLWQMRSGECEQDSNDNRQSQRP